MTRREFLTTGGAFATGSLIARPIRSAIGGRESPSAKSPLPYDAEVEYLESIGTQWIDTGIVATAADAYTIQFSVDTINTARQIFGAANDKTRLATVWGIVKGSCRFGGGNYVSPNTWRPAGLENYNMVECSEQGFIVNGKSFALPGGFDDSLSVNHIMLYGATGWAVYDGDLRIKAWEAYRGGILIQAFQPVRFTNEQGASEGAMYDRISGELFRNQGSGAFIVGPDI